MSRLLDLIDGVTKCDIARVAGEVLGSDRRYVVCLGPGDPDGSAETPGRHAGARTVRT